MTDQRFTQEELDRFQKMQRMLSPQQPTLPVTVAAAPAAAPVRAEAQWIKQMPLILAIAAQFAGLVWWAGKIDSRLNKVESDVVSNVEALEKIPEIKADLTKLANAVDKDRGLRTLKEAQVEATLSRIEVNTEARTKDRVTRTETTRDFKDVHEDIESVRILANTALEKLTNRNDHMAESVANDRDHTREIAELKKRIEELSQ